MHLKLLLASIGCMICFLPQQADAAAAQVSLSLSSLVQISGLTDVTFANVDIASDAVASQNVCTWSNSVTRAYSVTASGSGNGSAFELSNGGGGTIVYSVGWAGSPNASGTTQLKALVPSGSFASSALVPTCSLGPSASSTLTITIPAANLQKMVGGSSYTGSLTLLITPA